MSFPAPRRQLWASWLCALSTWMLAPCLVSVMVVELRGWAEEAVRHGIAAIAAFALLSPIIWLLLRRVGAFRVHRRIHALQISLWFFGWLVCGVALIAFG